MITACGIGAIVLFSLKLDYIIYWCALLLMTMIALWQLNRWHLILLMLLLVFSVDVSAAYDKISQIHLMLYLCASLYFALNAIYLRYTSRGSVKFSLMVGLILAAAFLYKYPRFLLGVEGGACDFLRQVWFPRIQDLTSPLEYSYRDSLYFCLFAATLFIALYDKICRMINKKYESMDVFWWLMIVLNVVYCIFASLVRRMLLNTAILSLPLFVDFAMNGLLIKTFFSRKIKILVAVTLILLPGICLKYVRMGGEFLFRFEDFTEYFREKQLGIHEEDKLYEFLDNNLGPDPVVIMADPYSGPKLLYLTRHNVVAVPFHSQKNGVISSLTITVKPRAEEKETRETLKSTNSSYVLVNKSMCACPKLSSNLANFMIHGRVPPWMEVVQLPISNNNFILAKVRRDKL
jgi:hypothetical protein